MNYEKLYKSALERAREQYNKRIPLYDIEYIFPELQESEDEEIRKAIHIYLDWLDGRKDYAPKGNYSIKDMIAWLKKQGNKSVNIDVESMVSSYEQRLESQGGTKYTPLVNMCLTAFRHGVENVLEELNLKKLEEQGEKKSTDNVKPKFKVGDWITDGHLTCKVLSVTGKSYELHLYNDDYCHFETDVQSVDKHYHLWTIEDAKEGDVLANKHNILILKELDYDWSCNGTPNAVKAYCGIKPNGNFEIGKDNWCFCGTLYIHPATKEQRDTLFTKMKELGYEWNNEKKELKKIEPKTLDINKVIG